MPPAALLRSAAASMALTAALAGCGFDKPDPSASPPPSAQELAYYRCLEEHGVPLADREDGQLRVDKEKVVEAVELKAQKACIDSLPGQPTSISKESLERERKFAACVRKNGFPAYPDPDPTTGEVAPTEELTEAMKQQDPGLLAARDACLPARTGQPVVGG